MASYEGPAQTHTDRRLRSLTRALAAVAVLVAAVLGIAVWALLERDDNGRGRARAAAVRTLAARVKTLESELQSPRRLVVSIRDAQRSLDERLYGLEHETRDAVDEIRKEVAQLRQRVDELEQPQSATTGR